MRSSTYANVIAAWILLAGCGGSGPGGTSLGTTSLRPTTSVVDGVTLITHSSGAFDRAPRLVVDSAPLAVIGGASTDPAYDLTWVYALTLLRDGRFAAFPSLGNTLLIFAADGTPQHFYGRVGSGPGDFMRVRGVLRAGGDTLLIPDEANRRLNWVTPDRGVVRTAPMTQTGGFGFYTAGMLPGGRTVAISIVIPQPRKDSLGRYLFPVTVFGPAGDSLKEVALLPAPMMVPTETRYGGVKRTQDEMPRLIGYPQAIVWDTLITTTAGTRYELTERTAAGRLVGRLSVPIVRRAVSQAMRDAQVKTELERLAGNGSESMVDPQETMRLMREGPFADSLPPIGQLFATPDRTLWVVDPIAPSDTTWDATAFASDGGIAGRLHVAGRGRPVAFGNDRVAIRVEDPQGVVTIRVHRIVAVKP